MNERNLNLFKKPFHVLFVAVIIVLIVGEVLAFVPVYSNSIDAWRDEGGNINYSVSTNASAQYTAVTLDNGDIYTMEAIVLYYDSNYPSHYSRDFLEDKVRLTIAEFGARNSPEITVADAGEVCKILSSEKESGIYRTALIMMTGVLPDTIYNATSKCLLVDWLNGGGLLYWMGDTLGMYVGTEGDRILNRHDGYGEIFFGADDDILVAGLAKFGSDESQDHSVATALNIEYNILTFGVDTSGLDNYLSIGYTDGEYDSLLLTKFHSGEGMIVLFGGPTSTDIIPVVAQLICANVNYSSALVSLERAELQRNSVTDVLSDTKGATMLYIYLGTPFVSYARAFDLTKL